MFIMFRLVDRISHRDGLVLDSNSNTPDCPVLDSPRSSSIPYCGNGRSGGYQQIHLRRRSRRIEGTGFEPASWGYEPQRFTKLAHPSVKASVNSCDLKFHPRGQRKMSNHFKHNRAVKHDHQHTSEDHQKGNTPDTCESCMGLYERVRNYCVGKQYVKSRTIAMKLKVGSFKLGYILRKLQQEGFLEEYDRSNRRIVYRVVG